MTQATEIFNKIQSKRKAIETITNWLSLNPISCINNEMRKSRSEKRQEIEELEKQLAELYEKSI
jgi:FtsZ-binding cell division protein ZapB